MIILESKIDVHLLQRTGKEEFVEGYFLTIDDLAKLIMDYCSDRENDNMIGLDTATIPYLEGWLKKHNRIVKKS